MTVSLEEGRRRWNCFIPEQEVGIETVLISEKEVLLIQEVVAEGDVYTGLVLEVVWCALRWCGVVWCGVVWCALRWCVPNQ